MPPIKQNLFVFSDTNDCRLDTCENGGECIDDLMMNYTCICTPGFEGVNCEISKYIL